MRRERPRPAWEQYKIANRYLKRTAITAHSSVADMSDAITFTVGRAPELQLLDFTEN
jgi:hypothetical protein